MRIHTNTLAWRDLYQGIPAEVSLDVQSDHGSRSHVRAFEVTLDGHGERHTRYKNSGSYGAATDEPKAATWDDYGFWLANLYLLDPTIKVAGWYTDAADFHEKTSNKFKLDNPPTD